MACYVDMGVDRIILKKNNLKCLYSDNEKKA